jgi:allantoicase
MDKQKLSMDHIHRFDKDKINPVGPVTHLRVSIYPDGGISRFRAFGRVDVLDLG